MKENKELRARLRIEENALHIDKRTECMKLVRKKVTKWERIMRLHGLSIEPQDIVDWLIEQHQAPHPLHIENDTMIMWLQAMDSGLSRHDLECYIKPVMQLWREQANPNQIYTKGQQDQHIAEFGANTRPVVLTITWQNWQQYLLVKEIEEENKEEELDKKDKQSSTELELSSIVSVDTSPADPVAVVPALTLEFTLNIAPVRPEFRPRTPTTDWPPLPPARRLVISFHSPPQPQHLRAHGDRGFSSASCSRTSSLRRRSLARLVPRLCQTGE